LREVLRELLGYRAFFRSLFRPLLEARTLCNGSVHSLARLRIASRFSIILSHFVRRTRLLSERPYGSPKNDESPRCNQPIHQERSAMNVRRIANASCLLLSITISSASFAGAQAGGPPSLAAIRAACADDAQKLCAGVQPGGGRIVACLREHKDSLSDRCKQAAGLPANPGSSSAPGAAIGLPSAGGNGAAGSPASSSGSVPGPSISPAAPATKAAPAAASAAAGEKFVERVITDTEHEGMRAATIHLPEKWHFESKIEWHYNWIEYPLSYSAHAENPD